MYWRVYVCMYRLKYMYQCIRTNPILIGKEGKNKMYLESQIYVLTYNCISNQHIHICLYWRIFVYNVYVSAWIYVSVYKNQSHCKRQRMKKQNVSWKLKCVLMYNCISLYVNICLNWRIYVCMYHLEYMYIVSAYKYMLALAYLCMYHLEYMYMYICFFWSEKKVFPLFRFEAKIT